MLFTYPTQAIEDNWIHDCIRAALEIICDAIDAGQPVPAWPEVLPERYRHILTRRRTLRTRLGMFAKEAQKLSIRDRAEFLSGFQHQNQIAELLDGTLAVPAFREALQPLYLAAASVCAEGFSLLGEEALRDKHYGIIYNHLKFKACPFCGYEPFEAPSLAREDDDHFLLKTKYPLAAANLANLVPMGSRCNQRYKRTADVLHGEDLVRRRALNPYGNATADISLLRSNLMGSGDGNPSWHIDLIPDSEETHTWDRVFSIRRRLTASVFDGRFDTWISELEDWFIETNVDASVNDVQLSTVLNRFVGYKARHREEGPAFFKVKVFEFLSHHFSNGNNQVIALIRSCLPSHTGA